MKLEDNMTLKEAQYLIKHIESGSLEDLEDNRTLLEKKRTVRG